MQVVSLPLRGCSITNTGHGNTFDMWFSLFALSCETKCSGNFEYKHLLSHVVWEFEARNYTSFVFVRNTSNITSSRFSSSSNQMDYIFSIWTGWFHGWMHAIWIKLIKMPCYFWRGDSPSGLEVMDFIFTFGVIISCNFKWDAITAFVYVFVQIFNCLDGWTNFDI